MYYHLNGNAGNNPRPRICSAFAPIAHPVQEVLWRRGCLFGVSLQVFPSLSISQSRLCIAVEYRLLPLKRMLASLRRFLIGGALLAVLVGLFLPVSWWLTLFACAGVFAVVCFRYLQWKGASILIAVLAMAALLFLSWKGILPTRDRTVAEPSGARQTLTTSCGETPTGKTFRGIRVDPERDLSLNTGIDELEVRRRMLRGDAARDLYQAGKAVDVDVTLVSISRILDSRSQPGLEGARKEVNDRSDAVQQLLKPELGLSDKEARRAKYREFDKNLTSLLKQVSAAKDPAHLDALGTRLFEARSNSGLNEVATKMFSLQESLLALTRESIEVHPTYGLIWDEDNKRAIYREELQITSRHDGLLDSIDASALKREADAGGVQFELRIKGGKEVDPAHVLLSPPVKQVTLVSDRVSPVELLPYCHHAPLTTIERLRFVWPSSDKAITLDAILTTGQNRLPVRFSVNRTLADTQIVQEIKLPKYSLYASRQPLEVTVVDRADVVIAKDKQATAISTFEAGENNWIEVFQKNWLLRSWITRDFGKFLVLENAWAAALAFALSAAFTRILPEKKK